MSYSNDIKTLLDIQDENIAPTSFDKEPLNWDEMSYQSAFR